jgi:hypothetical protein
VTHRDVGIAEVEGGGLASSGSCPANATGVETPSPGLAEERGLPWVHVPPPPNRIAVVATTLGRSGSETHYRCLLRGFAALRLWLPFPSTKGNGGEKPPSLKAAKEGTDPGESKRSERDHAAIGNRVCRKKTQKDAVPVRRSRTVRTLAKTPPLTIAMARPCQPIPKLDPKRQSTMQLTRAEWNPNKPSPSGDALKTSFKCKLYGTDPIASRAAGR